MLFQLSVQVFAAYPEDRASTYETGDCSITWNSDGTQTILLTEQYLKENKVLEIVIPDCELNYEITRAIDEVVNKWKGTIEISFLVL